VRDKNFDKKGEGYEGPRIEGKAKLFKNSTNIYFVSLSGKTSQKRKHGITGKERSAERERGTPKQNNTPQKIAKGKPRNLRKFKQRRRVTKGHRENPEEMNSRALQKFEVSQKKPGARRKH